MSWDKNTVNRSKLDSISEILAILEIPYKVEILGTVDGWGINDLQFDDQGPSGHSRHGLRKLTSEKITVLETMERTIDCDSDDEIESYIFKVGQEPKDWELEKYIDQDQAEFIDEHVTGMDWMPPDEETISDGFGSEWSAWCPMCKQKTMSVVRPGKVQCNTCG